MHRHEDIHRPDSRPFLKDPQWPRDDISASFVNHKDKAVSPQARVIKMHENLIEA